MRYYLTNHFETAERFFQKENHNARFAKEINIISEARKKIMRSLVRKLLFKKALLKIIQI